MENHINRCKDHNEFMDNERCKETRLEEEQ